MIGIMGGGLAAASLQYFLNAPCEILEKEDRPGGLCRTFGDRGYRYDIGGHILFSKDTAILNLLRKILGGNCQNKLRNNKILYKDRYVKYPFENGLSDLSKEEACECLLAYLENRHGAPTNFKEWIYHQFGDAIADKYLIPYNKKIWKFPLERMSLEWVERVPKPPLEDLIKSALGIPTEGYRHQLNFYYPKSGGIESLIRNFINMKSNKVVTNFLIRSVQKKGRDWIVSDGSVSYRYRKLISTIPPQELIKCFPKAPLKVRRAVSRLRYNSLKVILMGVKGLALMDKSAVYIPAPAIFPHRLCYMGYFSSSMVPKGCSSLLAEITCPPGGKLQKLSQDFITKEVVKGICKCQKLNKKLIDTLLFKEINYAYIVYDNEYSKNITIYKNYLNSLGIIPLGRFGEFEYTNMDQVVTKSLKLANSINSMLS